MSGITAERKTYLKQEATDQIAQAIAAVQNELQKSADVVEVPTTALAYWLQRLQSMKKGIDDPTSSPWSEIWINGRG